MIVFSHNHYYIYIKQKKWVTGDSTGKDRWVLYNDEQVYAMNDGWSEIMNDCLASKAYPSVLVYEALSEQECEEQPL